VITSGSITMPAYLNNGALLTPSLMPKVGKSFFLSSQKSKMVTFSGVCKICLIDGAFLEHSLLRAKFPDACRVCLISDAFSKHSLLHAISACMTCQIGGAFLKNLLLHTSVSGAGKICLQDLPDQRRARHIRRNGTALHRT